MGFLDELKDKAEDFGDKAKEGFGAAKDKAEGVIENVKDRFDDDDTAGGHAGPESVGETAPVGATEPAAHRRRSRDRGAGVHPKHGRVRGRNSARGSRRRGGRRGRADRQRHQGRVRVLVIIN